MKKTKNIVKIILVTWLVFLITDFALAQAEKPPIFAIPIVKYKDGGSVEYYGLGYKVIKYVDLAAERGPVRLRQGVLVVERQWLSYHNGVL